MFDSILKYAKMATLEPPLFLMACGAMIIFGSQVQTDLLIWKLCTKDLNFTEEICDNLSLEENDEYEIQVQRKLQDFELVQQFIGLIPAFVYAFFTGSFTDKFGRRKILMILPPIGKLIMLVIYIFNYAFIDTWPTEVFYASAGYNVFGGISMFWLGAYAYASDISDQKC